FVALLVKQFCCSRADSLRRPADQDAEHVILLLVFFIDAQSIANSIDERMYCHINKSCKSLRCTMEQLLNIMRELREKCPWDQQQTPESLTRYAIEEAYEVEAAVRGGTAHEVRDELGDLLLQVVFQSQMYSERGAFDFQDVVQAISDKLIRR